MTNASTVTEPATSTWRIDPTHTAVEFAARHMMITTVRGRLAGVEGTIELNDTDPARSSVHATLDTASLDTRMEQRDQHLRSADFLDVEKFPTITFKSTEVTGAGESFSVTGDLTIRGTTRPVTLDVTFEGRAMDPWGGERAGFTASTKIDRRDFGLTWNQAMEAGGVLVGNDIKINIELQAVRAV